MTQLSRETLEEIAELARKATYKPCAMHITNLVARCDSEVVEELIRELLERRERDGQEPVAYLVCNGRLYQDRPFLSFSTARISVKDRNDGAEIKSLYAAPPAPVAQSVQVPDELLSAMEEVLRISDRDHEAWQRAREGIAAFRAAMPQPSSGALQLPQWIPCSERLPPEATMVLGRCDNDYDFVNLLGGHLKIFCMGEWRILPGAEVTHWMPLPAAPQEPTKC